MHWQKTIAIVFLALAGTAQAEVAIPDQKPYPLPADALASIEKLASECDVLILGETHGTKEVPAVVDALLPALSKHGYSALALEVPHDAQAALTAWAKDDTATIPQFFAQPNPDGRGNEQALALIRRALRPPYEWKLICFDKTDEEFSRDFIERLPKSEKGTVAERAAKLSPADITALSIARDAAMAKNFATVRDKLPAGTKVLAVCGNVHARTANHADDKSPLKTLWPSFAAVLKRDHPQWQLRSINIEAFGGEFFNNGKVNKFGDRPLANVEAHPTPNADWDWRLSLPHTTAATFLQPAR